MIFIVKNETFQKCYDLSKFFCCCNFQFKSKLEKVRIDLGASLEPPKCTRVLWVASIS